MRRWILKFGGFSKFFCFARYLFSGRNPIFIPVCLKRLQYSQYLNQNETRAFMYRPKHQYRKFQWYQPILYEINFLGCKVIPSRYEISFSTFPQENSHVKLLQLSSTYTSLIPCARNIKAAYAAIQSCTCKARVSVFFLSIFESFKLNCSWP